MAYFLHIFVLESDLNVFRATANPASILFVHLDTEKIQRSVNIIIAKYLTDTCLSFVLKVYQEPLTAALNSNRAILSYADIHIVLSPVTQILELNRYTHTY